MEFCRKKTTRKLVSIGRIKVLFFLLLYTSFFVLLLFLTEAIGDVSDEKITQLKETVTAAEKENQVLTRECDEKEREAGVLSATPTNSSLSSLLKEAQEEKKTLSKKLQEAKKSGSSTSKTEIRQREKMLEKQVSVWRKRKSIAMDVINSVSEGSGKSPAKIMEEMGVESDEDYNVSLQKMTAVLQPAPKRARIGC